MKAKKENFLKDWFEIKSLGKWKSIYNKEIKKRIKKMKKKSRTFLVIKFEQ